MHDDEHSYNICNPALSANLAAATRDKQCPRIPQATKCHRTLPDVGSFALRIRQNHAVTAAQQQRYKTCCKNDAEFAPLFEHGLARRCGLFAIDTYKKPTRYGFYRMFRDALAPRREDKWRFGRVSDLVKGAFCLHSSGPKINTISTTETAPSVER